MRTASNHKDYSIALEEIGKYIKVTHSSETSPGAGDSCNIGDTARDWYFEVAVGDIRVVQEEVAFRNVLKNRDVFVTS